MQPVLDNPNSELCNLLTRWRDEGQTDGQTDVWTGKRTSSQQQPFGGTGESIARQTDRRTSPQGQYDNVGQSERQTEGQNRLDHVICTYGAPLVATCISVPQLAGIGLLLFTRIEKRKRKKKDRSFTVLTFTDGYS